MISPDQRKILNDLGKTQYGFALRKYLKEKYEKINDITSVTTWEETLGRQYALKLLKRYFRSSMTALTPSERHHLLTSLQNTAQK